VGLTAFGGSVLYLFGRGERRRVVGFSFIFDFVETGSSAVEALAIAREQFYMALGRTNTASPKWRMWRPLVYVIVVSFLG
jgi:hypothetical protein